ncbi:hypothetical protein DL764_003219 [Monosporascus ibericus]|uniref:Major facilitator superfamily (MFS) profile domain-containing protein n=1 Tax=Monosporascus ibericus TaxID=155417 RepID=A0A4Q4TJ46_9PEZI|nr:hypothetical protein DL764_003219 [Monosporascus ibericus]
MDTAVQPAAVIASQDPEKLAPTGNAIIPEDAEKPKHLDGTERAIIPRGDDAPDPNARSAAFRSLAHEILFVLTATISIAMPSFLQGNILIVSETMKRDLNMTTPQLTWAIASSSLTSGSFLLFFGKVADMFGRRAPVIISDTFSAIFSGIATQISGWSASFWLLAIIYLVVAIIACFTVPIDDSEKLPLTMESLKQFDYIGVVLTVTGIGVFTAGISVGPDAPEGWKTPYVLVFIVLGPLLLAAFVRWGDPLPLLAILLLGFLSFPALFFFIAISGVIVNILAGKLLHKVSNKLLMGVGAAGFTIAFLLVAVQRSGVSYWAFTFPAFIIVVFGTDFEFNVVNMYVVSSLSKSQQSVASSVFQSTIKLATVIGLGICAAVFASVEGNPATSGYYAHDPFEPYAALFWFATTVSFISLLLVPFLKIRTQGCTTEM